ncbi:uncharacterized protein [Parasteatoda tepidariorum]|uniref:uncharacterized protein n=1 Tax=Parasteatoda tepidariorum TaxID=114398 RepID=UPI001C71D6BA|nr:uncharacterized protein LOC122272832 [Parasteatoda tepidariorum]
MESYAIGKDNEGVRKEKRSRNWTLKTLKTESTERTDFINNFSEPPSLQRSAIVSLAIGLWTAPDIRNELTYILRDNGSRGMNELEKRILGKLFDSSLPSSLKTEISYVIRPIKLQLLKVFRIYRSWTGNQRNLYEYYMKRGTIYWTVEGTVDIVKSCTELFDSGGLDICRLYAIACSHCLGEYASIFWEKISEEFGNRFRIARLGEMYTCHFIIYWTCVLENNLGSFLTRLIDHENIYDDKLSIDVNMIACSINVNNIVALKYFWKKLSEQEKNDNLSKWLLQATRRVGIQNPLIFQNPLIYQYSSETLDVLCFLLSHVNRITQMTEFFRNHSRVLVFLFECWPYQRIFFSIIFELLDNLQEDIYSCIMQSISYKMSESGNEMMIFKEIWSASPLRLRQSFLNNELLCAVVLLRLLKLENLNVAVTILNDASKEEIKLFICFIFCQPEFRRAIYSSNLSSLHMLLSKSTLPKECYPYKINLTEQREQDRLIISWLIRFSDWHICIEWICDGNIQAAESFLRWVYQSVEIETFKKTISSPYVIYLTLIFLSNFERVDQFLNWYFQTGEEIQQFKADFLRKWGNYFFKRLIDMPFIISKSEGDVLQKFINYNLSSLVNVTEFRLICRSCIEYALSKDFLESATLLLNASFDDINEEKRYKNELILSKKGIKKDLILKQLLTDADWNHVKEIVMWSSPLSLNTVKKLKSLILKQKTSHTLDSFQDELKPQISALFHLLENVVEEDSR